MGLVDVVLGSGAKPGSQSAGGAELSRSFCNLAHRTGFIPSCEPHFAQHGFGIHCAEKQMLETCRYASPRASWTPTAHTSPSVLDCSGPTWLGNIARLQHSVHPENAVFLPLRCVCVCVRAVCVSGCGRRGQPAGMGTTCQTVRVALILQRSEC